VVVDGTMLAEIYSWFTEGFDTADLQDAKTLLEEFSAWPHTALSGGYLPRTISTESFPFGGYLGWPTLNEQVA
jgi:hypothetical protein